MKHTKGPWKLTQESAAMFAVRDHKGETLTFLPNKLTQRTDETISQTKANARLIAAAPELLEELKNAYGYLSQHLDEKRNPNMIRLVQAIAKAEGGDE